MSDIFQREVSSVSELQDIAAELAGRIAEYVHPELKYLEPEEREIIEAHLEEGIPNAVVRMFEKNPKLRNPQGLAEIDTNKIAKAMASQIIGRPIE